MKFNITINNKQIQAEINEEELRTALGESREFRNGEIVAQYTSQREAVRHTRLCQSSISEVLTGKRPHAGGYQFIYQNPELIK